MPPAGTATQTAAGAARQSLLAPAWTSGTSQPLEILPECAADGAVQRGSGNTLFPHSYFFIVIISRSWLQQVFIFLLSKYWKSD